MSIVIGGNRCSWRSRLKIT